MSEAPIRLVHTQNAVAQGLSHTRVAASEAGSIVVPIVGLTNVYNARGIHIQPDANSTVTVEFTCSWSNQLGDARGNTDDPDVTWTDPVTLNPSEIWHTGILFTFMRITFTGAGTVEVIG